jgi:hypothetical protein
MAVIWSHGLFIPAFILAVSILLLVPPARPIAAKIDAGIIWFFRYHFGILPNLPWSGVRWGLLSMYSSFGLYLMGLYFPLHEMGKTMIAWLVLITGGLFVVYSIFLGYRFMRAGSIIGTSRDNASKQDITDLKKDLITAITNNTNVISELVNEIRQERNERNDKPKQ